jgi:hypothetical protein
MDRLLPQSKAAGNVLCPVIGQFIQDSLIGKTVMRFAIFLWVITLQNSFMLHCFRQHNNITALQTQARILRLKGEKRLNFII